MKNYCKIWQKIFSPAKEFYELRTSEVWKQNVVFALPSKSEIEKAPKIFK
jgi:hypothetical protein